MYVRMKFLELCCLNKLEHKNYQGLDIPLLELQCKLELMVWLVYFFLRFSEGNREG